MKQDRLASTANNKLKVQEVTKERIKYYTTASRKRNPQHKQTNMRHLIPGLQYFDTTDKKNTGSA